jgi:formylglycine-generating enzyme required for sulfatase activity
VSWEDAKAFCVWLSERTGAKMRLPTEAEWEYAARAGGKLLKWAGTDNEAALDQYAWYGTNSDGKTHPVGEKRPNGLGLFDMSGNAYEWCWDRYDERYYGKSASKDPMQSGGKKIVRRGGSAGNAKTSLRCSSRSASEPDEWKDFPTGFRVVWTD